MLAYSEAEGPDGRGGHTVAALATWRAELRTPPDVYRTGTVGFEESVSIGPVTNPILLCSHGSELWITR